LGEHNFLFEDNAVLPRLVAIAPLHGLSAHNLVESEVIGAGLYIDLNLTLGCIVGHHALNDDYVARVVLWETYILQIHIVKGQVAVSLIRGLVFVDNFDSHEIGKILVTADDLEIQTHLTVIDFEFIFSKHIHPTCSLWQVVRGILLLVEMALIRQVVLPRNNLDIAQITAQEHTEAERGSDQWFEPDAGLC
jgi:hypothetical protein